MKQNAKVKLLSDQVSQTEIDVIVRELNRTLADNIEGDIVELGCYVGTTSVFLAQNIAGSGRALWLYDSFAGLPEKTSEDVAALGNEFRGGELYASRAVLERNLKQRNFKNLQIHIKKAWFSELRSDDLPDEIAFAFLDGDFYASINDSFRVVWPKLTAGGTVIVDDYANEALPGARRACDEWAAKLGFTIRVEASLAIIRKS